MTSIQYNIIPYNPLLILIAGGSGSGKSTLSKRLQKQLDTYVAVIDTDCYFREPHEFAELSLGENGNKIGKNYDHPAAVDFELMIDHVFDLQNGVHIPRYEFKYKNLKRIEHDDMIEPSRGYIIVEGIFAAYQEELRKAADHIIFVHASEKIRRERRFKRDREARNIEQKVIERLWERKVLPGHEKYVEPQREYATETVNGEKSLKGFIERFLEKLLCDKD